MTEPTKVYPCGCKSFKPEPPEVCPWHGGQNRVGNRFVVTACRGCIANHSLWCWWHQVSVKGIPKGQKHPRCRLRVIIGEENA